MDTNTEMFMGFLIVEWMIFLPLIVVGIAGCIVTKIKLNQVEKDLEKLER